MHVCVCACTCVSRCTPKWEGDGRYCSSIGWIHLSVLKPGLSLAWACFLGLTGWSKSPRGSASVFLPSPGITRSQDHAQLVICVLQILLGSLRLSTQWGFTHWAISPGIQWVLSTVHLSIVDPKLETHFLCKLSYVKVEFPPHPCESVELICVISH